MVVQATASHCIEYNGGRVHCIIDGLIQNLIQELRILGFPIHSSTPRMHCRVFEDNQSCIEIATNHKTRPRMKHLSVRLHHFQSHVVNKTISIEYISTKHQLGDIFTKGLPREQH